MDRVELRTKFAGKIEKFRLDEFDLDLHVKRLSAMARAKLGDAFKALENAGVNRSNEAATIEIQCRVIAQGLVTEGGARIYQDTELEAIADEFPATALDALAKQILAISGLGTPAEELAKNSEPAPIAASASV